MHIMCNLSSCKTTLQMLKLRGLNLLKVTKLVNENLEVVQDCLNQKTKLKEHFAFNC